MKITQSQLRRIIKEEYVTALKEQEQGSEIDQQKLKQEYYKFLKTQQGQMADKIVKMLQQNKGGLSGRNIKESVSDMDVSLTASGILGGFFIGHLIQTGLNMTPTLETNILNMILGILVGGGAGLAADFARHKLGQGQK
jgi:F0F1-type ATP synthase assembly protein I